MQISLNLGSIGPLMRAMRCQLPAFFSLVCSLSVLMILLFISWSHQAFFFVGGHSSSPSPPTNTPVLCKSWCCEQASSSGNSLEEHGQPWKTSPLGVIGPHLGQRLNCLEVSQLVTVRSRTGVTTVGLDIQEPLPEQGRGKALVCSPCWITCSELGPSLLSNQKKTCKNLYCW